MGIRVHIWDRAKVRRFITHSLTGGGSHQLGYDALDLDYIKQGNAGGQLGRYEVLSYYLTRSQSISLSFMRAIIRRWDCQLFQQDQAAALYIR